jgi:hypothetical protein
MPTCGDNFIDSLVSILYLDLLMHCCAVVHGQQVPLGKRKHGEACLLLPGLIVL